MQRYSDIRAKSTFTADEARLVLGYLDTYPGEWRAVENGEEFTIEHTVYVGARTVPGVMTLAEVETELIRRGYPVRMPECRKARRSRR